MPETNAELSTQAGRLAPEDVLAVFQRHGPEPSQITQRVALLAQGLSDGAAALMAEVTGPEFERGEQIVDALAAAYHGLELELHSLDEQVLANPRQRGPLAAERAKVQRILHAIAATAGAEFLSRANWARFGPDLRLCALVAAHVHGVQHESGGEDRYVIQLTTELLALAGLDVEEAAVRTVVAALQE
jgi:hypothetical protein